MIDPVVIPFELAKRILAKMEDDLERIIGEWGYGEGIEDEIKSGTEPEIFELRKILDRRDGVERQEAAP